MTAARRSRGGTHLPPGGGRTRVGRTASSRPGPGRPGGGRADHGTTVNARFSLSELPVVTVQPERAGPACAAAARALTEAGRGYLGGRLELRTDGSAPRTARQAAALTATEQRAATLAVASALSGGPGTARLRIRRRPG
ncbi:hypothetical protein ACWCQL_27700 [Streptomyces sp. NPDC002073]|uniref:hypothetical protein n=1 Tax=Streptomyces sp. NBC_00239 TaxID=2903640 RepID=UPI002E28639B|nr:hypothetical protein [Streptomyces sp. NBC_00239]